MFYFVDGGKNTLKKFPKNTKVQYGQHANFLHHVDKWPEQLRFCNFYYLHTSSEQLPLMLLPHINALEWMYHFLCEQRLDLKIFFPAFLLALT